MIGLLRVVLIVALMGVLAYRRKLQCKTDDSPLAK